MHRAQSKHSEQGTDLALLRRTSLYHVDHLRALQPDTSSLKTLNG